MITSSGRPVSSGWRTFLLVAAVYDAALGIVFLVAGESILTSIGMTLPPHVAYIQLAAVFVLIQGLSYGLAWLDPLGNLGLVRTGVAYKAGYVGLAVIYLVTGHLPSVFFVPWAILDALFLVGFVLFLRSAAAKG